MPNQKNKGSSDLTIERANAQVTVSMVFFQEHDKLLRENQELKIQVGNLTGQRDQLRSLLAERDQTIAELKRENEELRLKISQLEKRVEEQAVKIEEQAVKIGGLETELDTIKTYQKFADSSKDIFDYMFRLFCRNTSTIFQKTGDTSLYYLCDHLREFHDKKYAKWSAVKENLPLWSEIYQEIIDILENQLKINNIEVFFEIVQLRQERNGYSHTTEKITLDELRSITSYADEIWAHL